MFSAESLQAAAELIYAVMPPTPQIKWPLLCARVGTEVWIKHENHTPIGAFKLRGGIVYMEDLKSRAPTVTGVVAATRGNHGKSIAFASARAGLGCVIVVPHHNGTEKNAAMRAFGAELIEHGAEFQDALEYATTLVKARALHLVPSFHEALVLGVATYARELFGAVADLDACYVPIGLGSGICATIAVRDLLGLRTEIIGVVAAGAPAYALSFAAGRPMSSARAVTMADGVACRTPVPEALAIIQKGAARIVTVSDDEIGAAMRHLFTDTHNVAEGAGAAALAALLQEGARMQGRRVAAIQTGGNVDRALFASVLGA